MRRRDSGFTLIELLTVIAIIAILAAILLPVLGKARESARRSTCQSNLHQLAAATLLYTQDYSGRLPCVWDGSGGGASSLYGGWMYFESRTAGGGATPDPTQFFPDRGSLWEYVNQFRCYQCPDDEYATYSKNSYSLNGWLSRQAVDAQNNPIQNGSGQSAATFYVGLKLSRVRRPSDTMLFIEEGLLSNMSGSGGNSTNTLFDTTDDGYFFVAQFGQNTGWKNSPTTRHSRGYNVVYCDGHADYQKFNVQQVTNELWATPFN